LPSGNEERQHVSSSEIAHIDPPSATSLGASVLSALKAWRFDPARDRDRTIASTAVVPIVFGANAQSSPAVAHPEQSRSDPHDAKA
jgi:hypothetical protein